MGEDEERRTKDGGRMQRPLVARADIDTFSGIRSPDSILSQPLNPADEARNVSRGNPGSESTGESRDLFDRRPRGRGDVVALSVWTLALAAFFWDVVGLRNALFYFDITE